MGVFSFLKNLGRDIEGETAATITKTLNEKFGRRLSNLKVTVEGGTVTLAGEAKSEDVREKAVLLAGNIKGVDAVNDDGLSVRAPAGGGVATLKKSTFYTIKKGDTLSKIAKREYGSADQWTKLFDANQEVIDHPDRIYPGQTIRIPDLSKDR
jgi:nucleoid-associated protein YgaU